MALTIKQARKLLGKSAIKISDEDLEKEIQAAELLKGIFFNSNTSQELSNLVYNKENDKA